MIMYLWLAIFILFTIALVLPLLYWLQDDLKVVMNFKSRTKIAISISAIILFIMLISVTIITFNPEKTETKVVVTEVVDVYKNNDLKNSSFYYVSTGNDNKLYELKADKVTKGDKNYVITRTYENGNKHIELVIQNVSSLPSFNK